jgi:predicted transcriptional regulator
MQSSGLTRAVLGTLADSYPTAIHLSALASEVRCEPEALHRHLRLLHDVGAIQTQGSGSLMESAVLTEAGLALVRGHSDAHDAH